MAEPVDLRLTVSSFGDAWRLLGQHGANPADLVTDGGIWATARAHATGQPPVRKWSRLRQLADQPVGARLHLQLPRPRVGARGHLTVDDTRYDLLYLPRDTRFGPFGTLIYYRHVDPQWIYDLPVHTRLLLRQLRLCHTPRSHRVTRGRELRHLSTPDLLAVAAPLFDLPPQTAETITAAAASYPENQAPTLAEVLHVAHALT